MAVTPVLTLTQESMYALLVQDRLRLVSVMKFLSPSKSRSGLTGKVQEHPSTDRQSSASSPKSARKENPLTRFDFRIFVTWKRRRGRMAPSMEPPLASDDGCQSKARNPRLVQPTVRQKMKEHLPTYGLFFFSLLVMVPRNVWAQSQAINGTIQGAIRDDRGGTLARAAVVIRNLDTGTQRKLKSDARGRYRAPLLPLGSYEISAGLDGFATARRAGIVLEIAQTLNVDFILKLGSAGQS